MLEVIKRRTRCLRLSKEKMEGSCSRKEMYRISQLHHQDTRQTARYIGEIEIDCDLLNLKKHRLRYLTMKTTMLMMRIKLRMRSWKSKAKINYLQKQQSEQHDMDE